jgi:type I restriction enzyme M protein
MPHGVLFRGNAEEEIRRNLITKGYIKGVISLPPNLFYGTGIPACILLLDKEQAGTRKGIFMIDASQCYMKDGAKNRLRHQDIRKIVDIFNGQFEIPGYSRLVLYDEIRENDYNLNIPRYIDTSEPEVIQDIEAHLKGGIPKRDIDALDNFWSVFPSLKEELFEPSDREGYSQQKVDSDRIQQIIENNLEYQEFFNKITNRIAQWWAYTHPLIDALDEDLTPKEFIEKISKRLLESFEDIPLFNKYDVYQQLMDYWTKTMQDDVYVIIQEGWRPDQELIPINIIINKYFKEKLDHIKELESELEKILAQKEELEDEHSGEDGFLEESKSEAGNVTKSAMNQRAKEILGDPEFKDEFDVIEHYMNLYDLESATKKEIKSINNQIEKMARETFQMISEDDIRQLIINSKWYNNIVTKCYGIIQNEVNSFVTELKTLIENYSQSLTTIENELKIIKMNVESHLEKMGITDYEF